MASYNPNFHTSLSRAIANLKDCSAPLDLNKDVPHTIGGLLPSSKFPEIQILGLPDPLPRTISPETWKLLGVTHGFTSADRPYDVFLKEGVQMWFDTDHHFELLENYALSQAIYAIDPTQELWWTREGLLISAAGSSGDFLRRGQLPPMEGMLAIMLPQPFVGGGITFQFPRMSPDRQDSVDRYQFERHDGNSFVAYLDSFIRTHEPVTEGYRVAILYRASLSPAGRNSVEKPILELRALLRQWRWERTRNALCHGFTLRDALPFNTAKRVEVALRLSRIAYREGFLLSCGHLILQESCVMKSKTAPDKWDASKVLQPSRRVSLQAGPIATGTGAWAGVTMQEFNIQNKDLVVCSTYDVSRLEGQILSSPVQVTSLEENKWKVDRIAQMRIYIPCYPKMHV